MSQSKEKCLIKNSGIKSHKQRLERDREQDYKHILVRLARSKSASEFLRSLETQ